MNRNLERDYVNLFCDMDDRDFRSILNAISKALIKRNFKSGDYSDYDLGKKVSFRIEEITDEEKEMLN